MSNTPPPGSSIPAALYPSPTTPADTASPPLSPADDPANCPTVNGALNTTRHRSSPTTRNSLGRRIVVRDRARHAWTTFVIEIIERTELHVLVRDTAAD